MAMLVALSNTWLQLFLPAIFFTKASLQLCQSPNKVKLRFTSSLVSATSSTRPICQRRIFKTIFTQVCTYKVSYDFKQSIFEDDLQGGLRIKKDAELKSQLRLAMSHRPHHQVLSNDSHKNSPKITL